MKVLYQYNPPFSIGHLEYTHNIEDKRLQPMQKQSQYRLEYRINNITGTSHSERKPFQGGKPVRSNNVCLLVSGGISPASCCLCGFCCILQTFIDKKRNWKKKHKRRKGLSMFIVLSFRKLLTHTRSKCFWCVVCVSGADLCVVKNPYCTDNLLSYCKKGQRESQEQCDHFF